jgi:hypothetical protein
LCDRIIIFQRDQEIAAASMAFSASDRSIMDVGSGAGRRLVASPGCGIFICLLASFIFAWAAPKYRARPDLRSILVESKRLRKRLLFLMFLAIKQYW